MWIKICGITSADDAITAVQAGADAIGLNFYEKSKRCVSVKTASQIVQVVPAAVMTVGVFVNHEMEDIRRIQKACGLSCIQLHGEESAEVAASLAPNPVIRALRCDMNNLSRLEERIADDGAAGAMLKACLVDALVPNEYGGTGHCPPWEALFEIWNREAWPPLVLAGGLTAENVARAVQIVQPWGVDVASGVESSPGIKSPERVKNFILQARGGSPV